MLQLFTTKCLTFEIFHSDDATSCFEASELGRVWGGQSGRGPEPRRGPGATMPRTQRPRLAAPSGKGKRALGLVWVLLAFYFLFFNYFFLDNINIYIDILLWVGGE